MNEFTSTHNAASRCDMLFPSGRFESLDEETSYLRDRIACFFHLLQAGQLTGAEVDCIVALMGPLRSSLAELELWLEQCRSPARETR